MSVFFMVMTGVLGLAMLLSLYRVVRGPTVFDRLTGLGVIGNKTVILLILLGVLQDRVEIYVDISLAYALISFVGPIMLAKYFEVGGKAAP